MANLDEHQAEINAEFEELEIRWDNFISTFEDVAPKTYARKNNVFRHMLSETKTKEKFVEMARETRPFISKELWDLLENFMEFMKNLPDPEGANYRVIYKGMSPAGLVKRLITKRPIAFYMKHDRNILRTNPKKLLPGKGKWDNVARTLDMRRGDFPFLHEYISYDEILLAACVNMSTPTFFLSDGSRKNDLPLKHETPFIPEGVLCGLVGARLQKNGFMEHRFVVARDLRDKNFNAVHRSDQFWIKNVYQEAFPEGKIPSLEEVNKKPETYKDIYVNGINLIYLKKRLGFTVIPFIEEAVDRGREKKVRVVASVPPIGTGFWKGPVKVETIIELIVTTVLDYLDEDFDIENIGILVAIYLPTTDSSVFTSYRFKKQISEIKMNSTDKSIQIFFKGEKARELTIFSEFRYVAQCLPERLQSCLVVAGYAWDGNSYPGNEYWKDALCSFDSQSILCSNLGQFQNPEVNVKLAEPERIKVY